MSQFAAIAVNDLSLAIQGVSMNKNDKGAAAEVEPKKIKPRGRGRRIQKEWAEVAHVEDWTKAWQLFGIIMSDQSTIYALQVVEGYTDNNITIREKDKIAI